MELLGRPLDELCAEARALRDKGHGRLVTYSPKVFIPLTKLCRDVCHYCTFAQPPRRGERAYLTIEEVLEIARARPAAAAKPSSPSATNRSCATALPGRSWQLSVAARRSSTWPMQPRRCSRRRGFCRISTRAS